MRAEDSASEMSRVAVHGPAKFKGTLDPKLPRLMFSSTQHSAVISVISICPVSTAKRSYFWIQLGSSVEIELTSDMTLLPNLKQQSSHFGSSTVVIQDTSGKFLAIRLPDEETCLRWQKALREALTETMFRDAFDKRVADGCLSIYAITEAIENSKLLVHPANCHVLRAKRILDIHEEIVKFSKRLKVKPQMTSREDALDLLETTEGDPLFAEYTEVKFIRNILPRLFSNADIIENCQKPHCKRPTGRDLLPTDPQKLPPSLLQNIECRESKPLRPHPSPLRMSRSPSPNKAPRQLDIEHILNFQLDLDNKLNVGNEFVLSALDSVVQSHMNKSDEIKPTLVEAKPVVRSPLRTIKDDDIHAKTVDISLSISQGIENINILNNLSNSTTENIALRNNMELDKSNVTMYTSVNQSFSNNFFTPNQSIQKSEVDSTVTPSQNLSHEFEVLNFEIERIGNKSVFESVLIAFRSFRLFYVLLLLPILVTPFFCIDNIAIETRTSKYAIEFEAAPIMKAKMMENILGMDFDRTNIISSSNNYDDSIKSIQQEDSVTSPMPVKEFKKSGFHAMKSNLSEAKQKVVYLKRNSGGIEESEVKYIYEMTLKERLIARDEFISNAIGLD